MWSTIVTFVVTVWNCLPEITIVLKFCIGRAEHHGAAPAEAWPRGEDRRRRSPRRGAHRPAHPSPWRARTSRSVRPFR
jgi:hypothetical protein